MSNETRESYERLDQALASFEFIRNFLGPASCEKVRDSFVRSDDRVLEAAVVVLMWAVV